ncbi:MAG: hypothetical protein H7337_02050, partial [Rhizobacter sp.]|nr:hypothetical protein [Rhizobacter sp.]
MSPINRLIEAGLTLTTDGTRLVVCPTSGITNSLRALIVANKSAIWSDVYEAECQAALLIASINRCCDVRGDDDLNRAGLIDEAGNFTT